MHGQIAHSDRSRPPAVTRPGFAPANYYGRASLKPSPWDWKVPAYTLVAGVAGSAQVISIAAAVMGGSRAQSVACNGRYIAAAGAMAGAPLLIGDLHTPKRWYNMLRIFRATSPMSIGSYILSGFGALSTLSALAQAAHDKGFGGRASAAAATAAQIPAAAAGLGMMSYTAALLSATSSPVWAVAPRLTGVRFACSAAASGAAALSICEQAAGDLHGNAATLDRLAFFATAVDLVASLAAGSIARREGVGTALDDGSSTSVTYRAGSLFVGHLLPLACHAVNMTRSRPSKNLSLLASAAIIAGSYFTRSSLIAAGKASSQRPQESLHFARRTERSALAAPGRGGIADARQDD